VQRIILCPKCHVQVKKDNLGELLCPNCDARLCPKAHIFDGKICPHCGWEDPNYQLWKERQKARSQRPASKKLDESPQVKRQYTCPNCGTTVDTTRKDCPSCGFLGAKYRATRAAPISAASTTARSPSPVRPFLDKIPSAPPKKGSIEPTRSPLLKEIAKAERREWKFPPLRRFVRPVLASLLVGIVLSGLVLGGIYVTRFVSQSDEPGTQPPPPLLTPSKTYTLSTSVVPEAGGEIRIVSPSSSSGTFEAGSQITLKAIDNNCYTFDGGHWEIDGTLYWANPIIITMDSNKSVTAHFRLKDTTPPAISAVKATSYSDVSATITWETDKPATSHVEYGKTKDYGLSAKSNGEPTTSHKIRLTALEPSKTYYFMLKSADKCGNEATKTEMLTTLPEILVGDRVGNRAPDFVLPEYQDSNNPGSPNNGELVKLSDFKGKKILLNFWNTFCGACIGEFPYLRAIYEDKSWADKNSADSDFVIVAISIDEGADRVDRIAKLEDKYRDEVGPFTFPILLDTEENSTKDSYHIWTIPKTVFIDSDGVIREIKMGRFKDEGEIIDILNRLD